MPTRAEALRFWLRLGFISSGGPAGQIAIMHREVVELRRWIDEAAFLRALNFCTLLPGPEALQLAIYLGWRMHGVAGGLAAGLSFILPAAFLLLGLSFLYVAFGEVPAVQSAFAGLKAVVIAMILHAVWKLGRRALGSGLHVLIAAAALVALVVLSVPFPLVVAVAGLAGLALARSGPSPAAGSALAFPWRSLLVGLLLWLLPAVAVWTTLGPGSLHARVYGFFTQAALLTWGGAYAVLAYVNQALVESLQWVTASQAVAGLALAETTPGPLIIVLQFMGFMAGWTQAGPLDPATSATLAAALASYATFLPSFVFIFVGAPYVERLTSNARLAGALGAVTAVAVAAIASVAIGFGRAVLLPEGVGHFRWPLAVLALIALAVLTRTRVASHWVIPAGATAGWLLEL